MKLEGSALATAQQLTQIAINRLSVKLSKNNWAARNLCAQKYAVKTLVA